jgi:hypothetical protein
MCCSLIPARGGHAPSMKNVVALRPLLLVVALPALTSCSPSVQPIDVLPGCPEMPLRGPQEFAGAPAETLIDDFEDDNMLLPQLGGRDGSWMGSTGPMPLPGTMVNFEASTQCVARGTRSGHLTSTANTTYAASWTAVLMSQIPTPTTFNAGAYSGFSFWIARGDGAEPPFETPIGVTTADTAPAFGICQPCCCGDYYAIRTRIPLTRTWTRWFVRFTDLVQYGFGMPQVALRKDQLVSIIIWPEPQFDIWIDDLRFEP